MNVGACNGHERRAPPSVRDKARRIAQWIVTSVLVAAIPHGGCKQSSRHAGALQGIVEFEERTLSFETGGRLVELSVKEGDEVTAGQANAARAQQQLLHAGPRREDIRAAEAKLAAAKAQEAYLSKTLARHKKLAGGIGATPPATVDGIETQLRAATAERKALQQQVAVLRRGARPLELTSAKARTAAATAGVDLESERLRRHTLHAAIAGTVLDVPMEIGETVSPGAPVVVLADTRHPYADVFVPQGKLDGVKVGASAELHVDAHPEPYRGQVEYVSRRAEFTPRFLFSEAERPNLVIRVRIRIDDPAQRLHAGVPAFVYIKRDAAAPTKKAAP